MKLFIQSVGKGADYRDEVTRTISDVGAERFVNQLAAKGNAKAKIMWNDRRTRMPKVHRSIQAGWKGKMYTGIAYIRCDSWPVSSQK